MSQNLEIIENGIDNQRESFVLIGPLNYQTGRTFHNFFSKRRIETPAIKLVFNPKKINNLDRSFDTAGVASIVSLSRNVSEIYLDGELDEPIRVFKTLNLYHENHFELGLFGRGKVFLDNPRAYMQ